MQDKLGEKCDNYNYSTVFLRIFTFLDGDENRLLKFQLKFEAASVTNAQSFALVATQRT